MKKKGFTLVELLAVIVILAIIAVIATPIILNVIEDAKKGASESSAKGYLDAVEKQMVINLLDSDEENDITNGTYTVAALTKKGVTVKGDRPTDDSWIIIEDNKISKYELKIGDYIINSESGINKSDTSIQTPTLSSYVCKRSDTKTLHHETCNQTSSESYCSGAGYVEGNKGTTITYGNETVTDNVLTSGDAFDCDVNGDGNYDPETERFYYVSDYYNTAEDKFETDKAVLMYYSNTLKGTPDNTSFIAYNTIDSAGPVTGATNLPTTKQWSNISLINPNRYMLTYFESIEDLEESEKQIFDYSGYTARLASLHELTKHCVTINTGAPAKISANCNFLFENTNYANLNVVSGYWVESPYNDSYTYNTWHVSGYPDVSDGALPSNELVAGIRPVIEIEKVYIDY